MARGNHIHILGGTLVSLALLLVGCDDSGGGPSGTKDTEATSVAPTGDAALAELAVIDKPWGTMTFAGVPDVPPASGMYVRIANLGNAPAMHFTVAAVLTDEDADQRTISFTVEELAANDNVIIPLGSFGDTGRPPVAIAIQIDVDDSVIEKNELNNDRQFDAPFTIDKSYAPVAPSANQ